VAIFFSQQRFNQVADRIHDEVHRYELRASLQVPTLSQLPEKDCFFQMRISCRHADSWKKKKEVIESGSNAGFPAPERASGGKSKLRFSLKLVSGPPA
jgi:hypothetical protein